MSEARYGAVPQIANGCAAHSSRRLLTRHPKICPLFTLTTIQLSPLKQHCLKENRSPLSFFEHYFLSGVGSSWYLGLRHGIVCLGSCWALMLVLFGIGVGSIVWMAVLTGVMVVEKTYPGGQRLSPLLGIVLLLLAALWLVHPTWLLAGSGV